MTTDRNYWIHRIGHVQKLSYPLLEQGLLSYGWSDFVSYDNYIDNVRKEGGWEYMEKCMLDCWGGLTNNRYQLWRFLVEMKSGDWVIVPMYGEFSIYELTEDSPISIIDYNKPIKDNAGKIYSRNEDGLLIEDDENNTVIDLGLLRYVKPIAEHISRYKFADAALISRLKVRQTNVNINDLESSILTAIERAKNNKPIDFRGELDDIIPHICKSIQNTLDDRKFERLVKWYFERIGASNVDIPSRNPSDKESFEDIDVIGTFDHLKTVFYVQVKHHNGITADWAAKQIAQAKKIHEKSDNGDGYTRVYWALTSAKDFNEECKQHAQENNIQLITGYEFASMLIDVGFVNVNSAF